jgi:hypothetical protein
MRSSSHAVKHRPPPHRWRPAPGPVKLTSKRLWAVYSISAGVWVTGAAWLIFHYFMRLKSEFGFEAHPLEPWWLKLHGALAFSAMALLGLLWGVHVLNGWTRNKRRWSGAVLFGVACFLVVSGYLLYYLGDDSLRDWTSVAHWAVGLAVAALFVWHRFWDKAD